MACLFPSLVVFGQSSDNTISDLGQQVLQGMSPDQRDSILNQLGIGNGSDSRGLGGRRQNGDNQNNDMGLGLQPRLTREQQDELDRLSPFLAPGDWVVITVDSNPLPALPSSTNNLQQLGTGSGSGIPPGILATLQQNPAALGAAGAGASGGSGSSPAVPGAALAAAKSRGQPAATTATAGGYAGTPPPGQTRGGDASSQNTPEIELTDEQKAQRQSLIALIRSKNPYQLSREGVLSLPGFAPIPVAGLTEQLATLRIGSEGYPPPALHPRHQAAIEEGWAALLLKPFGYDMFDREISTFAPSTNVRCRRTMW